MTSPSPAWTMAPPWATKTTVDDAFDHAQFAWSNHLLARGYRDAPSIAWMVTETSDGQPMVTSRVVGSEAIEALEAFAGKGGVPLGGEDNQRPTVDYSEPGRVACVWRDNGVWVSLWAVEPPAPCPSPEPERTEVPPRRPCRMIRALIPWLVTAAAIGVVIATACLITR